MTVHDMLCELRRRGFDVMVAMKCVSNRPDIKNAPVIKTRLKKRWAGEAKRYADGAFEIALDRRLWLLPGDEAWIAVKDTFLHELAHLFSINVSSHGSLWQNYCRRFGIEIRVSHGYKSFKTAHNRMPMKLVAHCVECQTDILRARRLARGRKWKCRCGGRLLLF